MFASIRKGDQKPLKKVPEDEKNIVKMFDARFHEIVFDKTEEMGHLYLGGFSALTEIQSFKKELNVSHYFLKLHERTERI